MIAENRELRQQISALERLETRHSSTEGALRESEIKFKAIFESSIDAIGVSKNGIHQFVNRAYLAMFGYDSNDDLINKPILDVIAPCSHAMVRDYAMRRSRGESVPTCYELKGLRKDGTEFDMEANVSAYTLDGEMNTVSILRDITKRKRAEADLHRTETNLAHAQRIAHIGSWQYDPHTQMPAWSAEMFRIFGLDPLLGPPSYERHRDLIHPDDWERFDAAVRGAVGEGRGYELELRIVRPDGSVRNIITHCEASCGKSEGAGGLIGTVQDITERKQVEGSLRTAEKRFRNLLETVQLAAVILDRNANITFCNDYFLDLTGWSKDEVLNRSWFDLFLPEDTKVEVRSVFEGAVSGGPFPLHYENPVVTRDGARLLIVWDNSVLRDNEGRVIAVASIGTDVTEHRKLEAQLLQSQKMESIGRLAGGVAHDFNNMLTAIIGCASLISLKLNDPVQIKAYIDEILRSSQRASDLTQSLLAFARKQIMKPSPVDLNNIISGLENMLQRLIGEDIELKTVLYPGAVTVMADKTQMGQVIMNLCTNARDAMPEGGLLEIETGIIVADKHYRWNHLFEMEGKYAFIFLSDTGMGMDGETRARIFEPFFTTKEAGKGTGLGLSIVYGIVKQHGGYVNVYSEPGKGATFKIYLPVLPDKSEHKEGERADAMPGAGSETVLLAEDENSVRTIVKTILEEYGYNVIEAVNGEEAVQAFQKNRERIDIVLLDVIMPGKNGKAAFDEMKGVKPDIKVLFMSGYTDDIISSRNGVIGDGVEFIAKPVEPGRLLKKLRSMLD